jgi:hypothetical protein
MDWQVVAHMGGMRMDGTPHPRVFCCKSSEVVEKIGDGLLRVAKEFVRISNERI